MKQPIIKWGHETEVTDVSWLWQPFVPYGKVSLIEGSGGDGKTTMILTIAAMISQGIMPPTLKDGELLPSQSCEPQTVFYLSNEDEVPDSSLKRFQRAGGNPKRFAYSGELQYHVTLKEKELLSIIEQTATRLFIIDPYQAFLPDEANINNIMKTRPVFTMLSNVAKKTGCAIVLIGHLNKSEGKRDINRGFGSADIAASVRSILMVYADKRKRHFVKAIKSNFDEADFTTVQLVFDEEKRLSFEIANEEDDLFSHNKAEQPNKAEQAVEFLQEILTHNPMPITEIVKTMEERGISYRTAQRARRLIGAEIVSIDGIRYWKLPSCQPANYDTYGNQSIESIESIESIASIEKERLDK